MTAGVGTTGKYFFGPLKQSQGVPRKIYWKPDQ